MSRSDEIVELTRIRVLSFLREPEAVFWVFVFPIVLATVLGFAFRAGGVSPSKIAVIDGTGAERLVDAFGVDEHLDVELAASEDEAFVQLRKGVIDAMVAPDDPPTITLDPVRAEAETARLRIERALALADEGAAETPMQIEPITEKGSRYVDFLFPGLIGMNLMGTGMWGIGFAIADIRRRKFLRRMLVTPMRRSSFFLSFIFSRLVFLTIELFVLTAFGAWALGVPFRGDLLSYLVVCLLGAAVFAGLGILTASRVRTIEGASGLMNFIMMPMWLASGVFFSYERFPDALHPLIQLLPLTALNDALRAVMIDGESILGQGPEFLVMAVWCVVTFFVALKIFRWE